MQILNSGFYACQRGTVSIDDENLPFHLFSEIDELFEKFDSEIENVYSYSSVLEIINLYFESARVSLNLIKDHEDKLDYFLHNFYLSNFLGSLNGRFNKISATINKIQSNYPTTNFIYDSEDELQEFENLNVETKIDLLFNILAYNNFLLNSDFRKVIKNSFFIERRSKDPSRIISNLLLLRNHFFLCYLNPELLHFVDEDDIQLISQTLEQWDKIESYYEDIVPIFVIPTIAYTELLAFKHYYLAFKGDSKEFRNAIKYLESIDHFYRGEQTSSEYKKLKSFTKLGKYSYTDILKFLSNVEYEYKGYYINFIKKGEIFRKDIDYLLYFGIPRDFYSSSNIMGIIDNSAESLQYHLNYFNKFEDWNEFYQEILHSEYIYFNNAYLKSIKFRAVHGFPKSPRDTLHTNRKKLVFDRVITEIYKTLKISEDIGIELIVVYFIDLLVDETILDTRIATIIISYIVMHIIKNKNKEYK